MSLAILTTDKRVAMVVLDTQDYINKEEDLLEQWDTYRTLSIDPIKICLSRWELKELHV